MEEVQGIILAGGFGTRLRTVVSDRPKPLARVGKRPFLSFLLDQLVDAGICEITLCTYHLAHLVEAEYGSNYRSATISYSVEPQPLGTAGAVRNALPVITMEKLLVMNGDSFCHYPVQEFVAAFQANRPDIQILTTRVDDISRYGSVDVDEQGFVRGFCEKGSQSGEGIINAGVYATTRKLIEAIPPDRPVSLEKEVFPSLVDRRMRVFTSKGPFIDIGTPESYALAEAILPRG